MAVGWDARRVAEIIPVFKGGRKKRGSGYRITETSVLTSAHVVEGAERVVVRFEAGTVEVGATEWEVEAGSAILPGYDVAILPIINPGGAGPVPAPDYGKLGSGLTYPTATAVGFPHAQLRTNARRADGSTASYRDSKQAIGNLAPLSQLKSGNFEFGILNPPPGRSENGASSWAGMSGAAVWVAERLVGVVTEDVYPNLANTLTVAPLAKLWDPSLPESASGLSGLFGGSDPGNWTDVSLADSLQSVLADHHRQVLAIAPAGGLLDREQEISQMTAFCRQEDREEYWWWRAGPWAGKTGLMSSFVAQAPSDLRVVSFFVDSQREGRRDSRAFMESVLPQLDAVVGNLRPTPMTPGAEDQTFHRCLDAAARACRGQGARLVLAVDALDEDIWTDTSDVGPSIASLLPADPDNGLRIIVSSRLNPGVPSDVPEGHPLTGDDRVRHRLSPSKHAKQVKETATLEIKRILKNRGTERDAVILIALAGALSVQDIMDITGQIKVEVGDALAGSRVLRGEDRRLVAEYDGGGEQVYALSHATLPELVKDLLGPREISVQQDRIHVLAEKCRQDGWPDTAPRFFLSSAYPKFLAATGQLGPLVDCATDRRRQARLLERTGSHFQTLEDIRLAQNQNLGTEEVDLVAALRLCITRNEIEDSSADIPPLVPSVYAQIGQPGRAVALAKSIGEPKGRDQAITEVSGVLISAGRFTEALASVRGISDAEARSLALTDIARALSGAGQDSGAVLPGAIAEARDFADPLDRSRALAAVARALSGAGLDAGPAFDEALATARQISDPGRRSRALRTVTKALAGAGHFPEALGSAREISYPGHRSRALAAIAGALNGAGLDPVPVFEKALISARETSDLGDRSRTLMDLAGEMASAGQDAGTAVGEALSPIPGTLNLGERSRELVGLAGLLASAGQDAGPVRDEALASARGVPAPQVRSRLLAAVAGALAGAGLEAGPAFDEALSAARQIGDLGVRSESLAEVAEAFVGAGRFSQALAVAQETSDPGHRAKSLAAVAEALAGAGRFPDALAVARQISYSGLRSWALVTVAKGLAGPGLDAGPVFGEAVSAAREISSLQHRSESLAAVARALADAGLDAGPVLGEAVSAAREIISSQHRSESLAAVAGAWAGAGLDAGPVFGEAVSAAREIADARDRSRALADVGRVLANAGLDAGPALGESVSVALGILDPGHRSRALTVLGGALAGAGQDAGPAFDEALTSARHIPDAEDRSRALGEVAGVLASTGRFPQALAAAREIPDPGYRSRVLGAVAGPDAGPALGEAAAAAREIASLQHRSWALAGVGEALAGAGLDAGPAFGEAVAVAREIPDARDRPRALVAVAKAMAGAGLDAGPVLGEAVSAAREVSDRRDRSRALADVGTALAGGGLDAGPVLGEAVSVVREVSDPRFRSQVLADIARAMSNAGLLTQALAAAREVSDRRDRSRALAAVAGALAGAGLDDDPVFGEALVAARELQDPEHCSEALEAVAGALAGAGRLPAALDIAQSITRASSQRRALMHVAHSQLQAGAFVDAAQTMERAASFGEAKVFWAEFARMSLDAGHPVLARKAATNVLSTSSWIGITKTLCEIEPRSLAVIKSAYLPSS